ncbi:hypothetical protein MP228_011753 [Amoeboaphelidium protococcarum]|nr:hypothetical protein MP228_011753 [Amoeboaphelidium protococcarum]
MAQLANIGDRHRITQGFCDSVNRIYSEFYPRVANLPGTRILTGRKGHFQPNWHRCLRLMHFLQQYNYANGLVHFNVVPDVKLRPFHIKLTKDLSRSSRLFGPTAPESVERLHNILTVPQYIQNRVESTRSTDLNVVSTSQHVTSLLCCLLCIWLVLKSINLTPSIKMSTISLILPLTYYQLLLINNQLRIQMQRQWYQTRPIYGQIHQVSALLCWFGVSLYILTSTMDLYRCSVPLQISVN